MLLKYTKDHGFSQSDIVKASVDLKRRSLKNRWDEIINDKVPAAAMADRLTHKAYLVDINGQSYRYKDTQKIMRKKIQ